MNPISTFVITVLLSLTVSLPAQEKPAPGSKVPDPAEFSDLLREKAPAPSEVETSPRAVVKIPPRAKAEASGDVLEVDRVLAEARMKLRLIVEESATGADEVRNVFDETLEFITLRLQDLKERDAEDEAAAKKQPARGESAPVAEKVDDAASPSPGVEAPAEPGNSAPKLPPAGKGAGSRASFLLQMVERLRALADELEAEAGSSESVED